MFKNKKVYFGIIYSYLNTINGKVYVGQTTRPINNCIIDGLHFYYATKIE